MARDQVIETVVRNWAPRFISNGVPLFDYQEVTDGLEAWEDWCGAWSARAAEHEAGGPRCARGGLHAKRRTAPADGGCRLPFLQVRLRQRHGATQRSAQES